MANTSTISIGFKVVDGGNGLHTLTMNANDLRQVLRANVEESERLQRNFVNFAAVCTSIDSVSETLGSLKSVVDDLAGAYDIQIEAETRLEQVMRNTMDATDEQIQSIKDFCSAQQQIGVVGDEVQLAGAQELATYVSLEGSLKSLIPVMNDMLVQQYGLAASGEAATQIAGMLGKVLDGQTGALSRYGYKFDEAQEKILKYGTETERVATLAEVVSQSVGGMNAAMAQTESGRMQQLANNLGDVKEELGRIVKGAQAPLTIAANATIALGGVSKLISGIKALNTALGLTKALSGWIGIALTALGAVLTYLYVSGNEAADGLDNVADAEERAARAAEMAEDAARGETEARMAANESLELNIARLQTFNGSKKEEKKLVDEMNVTYGRTMGYFKSVAEWYQALITNSKAYCQQMVNEERTRRMASQIAEWEESRSRILKDENGNTRRYSKTQKEEWRVVTDEEERELRKAGKTVSGRHVGGRYVAQAPMPVAGSSDLEKAQEAYDDYTEKITAQRKELEKLLSTTVDIPMRGSEIAPEEDKGKGRTGGNVRSGLRKPEEIPEGSIADYKNQITDIEKKIRFSIDAGETFRLEQQKMVLEKKITDLEIPVKIARSKEKFEDDWKDIKPIEIPVRIDVSELDKDMKALPAGVDSAEQMKRVLGDISGLASAAGDAFGGMGKAFEVPALDVMGIIAGSIATMIQGYATATSQAASMGPISWAAFGLTGLAQLMTMISQVKAAVPFANGGIVSGPTYALVGEYAGASSNPEVIAPLDRLRDLIGSGQGAQPVIVGGRVEIDGRKLAVVLENQSRIAGASGRRYGR